MEVSLQKLQPKLPHLELTTGTPVFQSDSLHRGQVSLQTSQPKRPHLELITGTLCVSVWQPPQRSAYRHYSQSCLTLHSLQVLLCFSLTASMEISLYYLHTLQLKLPHLELTTGALCISVWQPPWRSGQFTDIAAKTAPPWTHYRYPCVSVWQPPQRSAYRHCSQSCLTLNSL